MVSLLGCVHTWYPGTGARVRYSLGTQLFLSTCANIRTWCRCPRTRSRPCTRALKWALGPYETCFSVGSQEFYPQSTSSHTLTPCNAPFAKMVSAERAKWTKDNLGTQSVDKAPFSVAEPNIQMGGRGWGAVIQSLKGDARSQKIFFRPFASQFGLKIRGWARRAPPLDPPLIL